MASLPSFELVSPETLLDKVRGAKEQGYRIVQIGATRLADQLEVTYSFDREAALLNFRLRLPAPGARLPSITSIFWCAFLYENELHDLFGIEVEGMAVDFHGNLYRTSVKFPFGCMKVPQPGPTAAAAKAAPASAHQP
jgi:ech hydrogenase subunit D